MDYRIYIIDLYDIYSNLLTEKQQNYFEDYYFNNLTLSEISENNNISRNGVYKQVKEAEEKLNNFENKLKIYDRNKKILKFTKDLDEKIKEKIEDLL